MLSKSDFMKYVQCPCALWLHKVRPDLMPPADPGQEFLFATGRQVDDEARRLFEDGLPIEGWVYDGWRNTQAGLRSGRQTLFQPTAVHGQFHARADILTANPRLGAWDIREVKMTTRVKEDHLLDLAFQAICFDGAKVPVGKTYLVHINNRYVRKGDIDPQKLFAQEDVTEQVKEAMIWVNKEIPKALAVMTWPKKPSIINVEACVDNQTCEWLGCYVEELPPKLRDEMRSLRAEPPLPNPPVIRIDRPAIRAAIKDLPRPFQILDYETFSPAIPMFDGYRPYEAMTFQYSLHIQDASGKVTHAEYLEDQPVDPTPRLAKHLREHALPGGTFLAWYAKFEKSRNEEMAKRTSGFEDFFASVNERMYDPINLFKKRGGAYFHSGFRGSASLKVVLPTLVPELHYGDLAIQKGDVASQMWPVLTAPETTADKKAKLRQEMIDYCSRDTLGVVKIMDQLVAIADAPDDDV